MPVYSFIQYACIYMNAICLRIKGLPWTYNKTQIIITLKHFIDCRDGHSMSYLQT